MREIRISITAVTMILLCLGVIMIYSSSGVYAMEKMGDSMHYLKRHVVFLLIGSVAGMGIMAIDYRDLRKWAKPLLVISVFLLLLVLVPGIGKESFGARRWFRLGFFYFQPSELAKLAMLVYTADYCARKHNKLGGFVEGLMPILMVLGVVSVLILKQPDLGSTVLIASVVLIMVYIAGARTWHLGILALFTVPGFYYLIYRVPYRWRRIMIFLDPWGDSQGAGFQLTQSQIAFGSGGLFGLGLGHSVQKLYYLPAAHTDFILSIIGEELGYLGSFTVVVLFVIFIWQGARIAKRTTDPFGHYLSLGIVAMIGLQAVVNVGVSIGALPTKGLPLPFVSYGGSALVFNMMFVGLLLNISRIQDL